MYTHICTYTCVRMYMRMCTYVYDICMSMHACIHVDAYVPCVYMYIYRYILLCIHIFIYIYICMHVSVYMCIERESACVCV